MDSAAPIRTTSEPAAGLLRGGVSYLGGLAQSVGLIGPSAGAGIIVGAIFGTVGPLGWLSWLIGTLAICCVAYAVVVLSRRFLTTGGLYPLAAKAGGKAAGYFTAFGALFWLLVAAPAVVLTTGIFANDFLSLPAFGLQQSTWWVLAFSVVTLVATAWIAYAGIKISVHVLLAIELVTGAAIVLLLLITLFKHPGGPIDHAQFHFAGAHLSSIVSGIVLVTFGFGGFESATILGQEAHEGRRNIPLAVVTSILIAGFFIMLTQYVTVLGFEGSKLNLVTSPNALGDLARIDGIGWYAYLTTAGLVLATFANNIALYNAGARMLYTLPREIGKLSWLAKISPKHRTPTSGILTFAAVNAAVMVAIAIWRLNPVTAYGDLGTMSGYGTIVMYAVTCIATIVLIVKVARRNALGVVICLAGAGIICYGAYTLLHPFPIYPASVFAWIFIASAVAAILGYLVLRARRSTAFAAVSVDEDTALSP